MGVISAFPPPPLGGRLEVVFKFPFWRRLTLIKIDPAFETSPSEHLTASFLRD